MSDDNKPPDLNTLISEYESSERPIKRGDLESLNNFIQRLNAPWTTGVFNGTSKCNAGIATSLPGDLGNEIAMRLSAMPYFQRLNYVSQLGLVRSCVNLDGCHSRLSHCIGTVSWAYYFLETIDIEKKIPDSARLAVLIAAFIHDAKHGPFGHSLDMLRDVFAPNIFVRLDKYLLKRALQNPESQLNLALRTVLSDLKIAESEQKVVFEYLNRILDKNSYIDDPDFENDYYLSQIIDSDIDADRIDYIIRDSMHIGRSMSPNASEISGFIRRVRVLPVNDPNRGKQVIRLCFSKNDKESLIDRFLQIRRDLYLNYYESPEKLIADDMLAHVVYYALVDAIGISSPQGYSEPEVMHEFTSQFVMLTDHSLIQLLYEIECKDPKSRFALHMLNDLLRSNNFVEVGRESIRVGQAKNLWEELENFNTTLEKQENLQLDSLYGKKRDNRFQLNSEQKFRNISQVLKSFNPDVALLHFVNVSSGGFENKYHIEKEVWNRLLQDKDFHTRVLNYFYKLFGAFYKEDVLLNFLQDIPLVHITIPTYAATSAKEIEEYATEPSTTESVAYYSKDQTELITTDLPRSEQLQKPMVLLSTTRYFATRDEDRNKILQIWKEFLFKDIAWAKVNMYEKSPIGNGKNL